MQGIVGTPGTEANGGLATDMMILLMQALLPNNPTLHLSFIGPEVEARPPRVLAAFHGKAEIHIPCHSVVYHELPEGLPRPHLFIAQNAGLQHNFAVSQSGCRRSPSLASARCSAASPCSTRASV